MKVVIKWFDLRRVCKKTHDERKAGKRRIICKNIKYSEYDEKPECNPQNCPLLED